MTTATCNCQEPTCGPHYEWSCQRARDLDDPEGYCRGCASTAADRAMIRALGATRAEA